MSITTPATVFIVLSLVAQACGGDNNNQTGSCLTDEQICSLELGVTKKDDVIKRFGTPTLSSSGTSTNPYASYTCVIVDQGVVTYSQGVSLQFDTGSVLKDVEVTRGGRDARPTPACVQKLKS